MMNVFLYRIFFCDKKFNEKFIYLKINLTSNEKFGKF